MRKRIAVMGGVLALAFGDKILEITHSEKGGPWKFDRELGWANETIMEIAE